MTTTASQEIVLRALIAAGNYDGLIRGQTGPDVCRWLLAALPDSIWQKVGAGRVYDVPFEHWWKALRWTFDQKGTLDELVFQAAMEEHNSFERLGGMMGVGKLYHAAATTGWLYLADMDGLRGHVDRILNAAQQRRGAR